MHINVIINPFSFLAKHAPNFAPVEREPQYNYESVFVRKGKEHGSLLFSVEVTGTITIKYQQCHANN